MTGLPFIFACIYMTFTVAFVVTMLELRFEKGLWWHTFRRWGKFLLLLGILGIIVQVLTMIK